MSDRIEAVVTHQFPFSADRVFECWLRPDVIRQWMSAALQTMGLPGDLGVIEVDARVGGRFCFSDKRSGGEAFHWGTYRALDFPTKIAFTWNAGDRVTEVDDEDSLVTITLVPMDGGCTVTLVHSLDAEWIDYLERTKLGWSNMIVQIHQLLLRQKNLSVDAITAAKF